MSRERVPCQVKASTGTLWSTCFFHHTPRQFSSCARPDRSRARFQGEFFPAEGKKATLWKNLRYRGFGSLGDWSPKLATEPIYRENQTALAFRVIQYRVGDPLFCQRGGRELTTVRVISPSLRFGKPSKCCARGYAARITRLARACSV